MRRLTKAAWSMGAVPLPESISEPHREERARDSADDHDHGGDEGRRSEDEGSAAERNDRPEEGAASSANRNGRADIGRPVREALGRSITHASTVAEDSYPSEGSVFRISCMKSRTARMRGAFTTS